MASKTSNNSPARKLPPNLITSTMVTFYVTPECDHQTNSAFKTTDTSKIVPKKVMLHKDFVCYNSPFFDKGFNSSFQEGLTQEMNLQVDETAFGVVATWFYSQKVERGGFLGLVTLAKVWILAERFMIPRLQNMVMIEIHKAFSRPIKDFGEFAKIACNHGDGKTKLAEIAIQTLVNSNENFLNNWVEHLPPVMITEVLVRVKRAQKIDPFSAVQVGDEASLFFVKA